MKIVPKVSKDELWKGIIEELFEDFLHFFFPEFVHEVDFTKPYTFLDKELQQLLPASESQNRRVDVLVKVFLKSGAEKWLLIHVEVQGYEDKNFPKRMYVYNYRIYDRFEAAIVALAILTDENPDYRPSCYEVQTWNTKIRYEFQTYKLLEHDISEFELSNNPFASVMQIARSFIGNKALKTDEDLLSLKLMLFRKMYKKGHNKEVIRKIANFIKLYVFFKNHDFFNQFEIELDKITNYQPSMGLLELIKQRTLEEAARIGLEQGMEQGMEQGIRKTITKMLLKNFSVETIADILDISVLDVSITQQMIAVKSHFKNEWTIEKVLEQFKKTEQVLLLSTEDLKRLHKQVQVEQLLSDELSVDEIIEKLDVSTKFVMNVKKDMVY